MTMAKIHCDCVSSVAIMVSHTHTTLAPYLGL